MIKFGTSGWRGIIADDFTSANVRLVTQAIVEYIRKEKNDSNPAVVIGYDTRFLSERFAAESAKVLAGNGIKALLCGRDTPTPVISFEIMRRKLSGGINFTASHNPPQYNGLKFNPSWGGPALPETTEMIEGECAAINPANIKSMKLAEAKNRGLLEEIDPRKPYFRRIKELVNFKAIKKGNLKVATDVLYGTGKGYLDELLDQAGVRQIVTHDWRDVMFGGKSPEPNSENLKTLYDIMKKESCRLGLATDGDADRFGILDSDGSFINANATIAVLLYHLIKSRQWKGSVARSVMTTHLIDRVAEKFGVEVKETPVGFKFIGEVLIKEGDRFIIGGEESGGLSIRGHVPEKDGVLACLLVAEMVAEHRKSIKKILEEITKLVGPVYSDRINFHLTQEEMDDFKNRLKSGSHKEFGGMKISKTITLDGYKFVLADGSWLGVRLSGTEPVVRLYLESDSPAKMKKLAAAGKKFIVNK
ncbi:MAG: phosphoglucomutase/phosphomannomutase family protein [Elusimicrobiota bacterium]